MFVTIKDPTAEVRDPGRDFTDTPSVALDLHDGRGGTVGLAFYSRETLDGLIRAACEARDLLRTVTSEVAA